jgi:hypothetical protein
MAWIDRPLTLQGAFMKSTYIAGAIACAAFSLSVGGVQAQSSTNSTGAANPSGNNITSGTPSGNNRGTTMPGATTSNPGSAATSPGTSGVRGAGNADAAGTGGTMDTSGNRRMGNDMNNNAASERAAATGTGNMNSSATRQERAARADRN